MTVHRDNFLVGQTNRRTEFQFIAIMTLQVSGYLSTHHQEFLSYIDIGTFYAVLMNVATSFDDRLLPGASCL
jgi:hypothetical protein